MPIFFYGHGKNTDYGCLSNFYDAEFTLNGKTYPTSEHYFMEQKALLFGDTVTADKILKSSSPYSAKKLGRQANGFDQHLLDDNKFRMMKEGVMAKFQQNDDIREILLNTNDEELVEAAANDRIWGIGYSKDNIPERSKWGENNLGKVLMEVREELR